MKKFLIISGSLLAIALLATVVVFWYISMQLKQGQSSVTAAPTSAATTTNTAEAVANDTLAPAAIPLKDVPLTDAQRDVIETVGVDVETFVITPAMQACVMEKLGEERTAEIAAGGTPTALETVKLVPCLGAQ